MNTYSKTVYLEVDAENEEDAETCIADVLDGMEGRTGTGGQITNVDLAGPIEECETFDASSIEADPMAAQRRGL